MSTAKVPRSTTGTAMVGINVARMLPMNSHMTRKTRTTASKSVLTTSWMATFTNGVVSYGYTTFMPAGKYWLISASLAFTALAVSRALAPGAWRMAMPAEGLPLKKTSTL